MAMIKWIVTTSAVYNRLAAQEKDTNALYFLEDTREIYKGASLFTQSTELVSSFPEAGAAQGRIYINQSTLEGRIWNGSEWRTVIEKVAQTLTEETETKAVSGEAVKQYVKQHVTTAVADKVKNISFDKLSKQLTYETGNGTVNNVNIDGFLTGAKYNQKTGMLSFDVQGGRGIHINLPKDNFVESGRYDTDSKSIILELVSGDRVEIPAEDLIDVNEFESTATIDMTVTTEGKVSADVIVDQTTGNNQLRATAHGLYVEATDLSNTLSKVATNKANEIIVANEDGTVKVSGLQAGTDTITGEGNVKTLATEAAVAAIRTTLTNSIAEKINLSAISRNIPQAEVASFDRVASEKAVATAIDELKGQKIDKDNITTELPTENGSTDKVASEAAVVAALSWSRL